MLQATPDQSHFSESINKLSQAHFPTKSTYQADCSGSDFLLDSPIISIIKHFSPSKCQASFPIKLAAFTDILVLQPER